MTARPTLSTLAWRLLLLPLLLLRAAPPSALAADPAIGGFVRQELAATLDEADLALVRTTAEISLEYAGEKARLLLNPFLYLDLAGEPEAGLREAFLDLYFPAVDLRIGQQAVIWGKAEGVFITDIVSPKDLRRFLLPEFREIRLAIPAVKAGLLLGPGLLELVYAPLFIPSRLPEPGSIWFRQPALPELPIAPTLREPAPVEAELANGELFGRLAFLTPAFDLELVSGWMWSDEPAPRLEKTFSAPGVLSDLTVTPEYYRLAVAGGSFSTALGALVLRGEGALSWPKRFLTADPADADGFVERAFLQYLVGVDFPLLGLDGSVQFSQDFILEPGPALLEGTVTNLLTVRLRESFLNDTLSAELFAYIGLDEPDALLRPKLTWAFDDGLNISLEADLFLGEEGRFGRYSANPLGVLKVGYDF